MNTSLEQIRSILEPYMSDKTGLVEIPEGLLPLLEEADDTMRNTVAPLEGALALYAVNRISKESLRERLRSLLESKALALPAAPNTGIAATYETHVNIDPFPLRSSVLDYPFRNSYGSYLRQSQVGYVVFQPASWIYWEMRRKTAIEDLPPRLVFVEPQPVSPYDIKLQPIAV
jgi:hypothetical protein